MRAYSTMLPRLEAERDLRLFSAVAAGSGAMKPAMLREYLRSLASSAKPKAAQRVRTLDDLRRAGMTVVGRSPKAKPRG